MGAERFAVVDLFSGAGGMSYGFHKHTAFEVLAAADAELGKPSTGQGKLQFAGGSGPDKADFIQMNGSRP